jgi:hypothetical protein
LRDGLLQDKFAAQEFIDPTPKYIEILPVNIFNKWFCLGRSSTLSMTEVSRLVELGEKLLHNLKHVFPHKTGTHDNLHACCHRVP